jgi:hypothetical protein
MGIWITEYGNITEFKASNWLPTFLDEALGNAIYFYYRA